MYLYLSRRLKTSERAAVGPVRAPTSLAGWPGLALPNTGNKLTSHHHQPYYLRRPRIHPPPTDTPPSSPSCSAAMAPQTYYLVSLPSSISSSGDASEALTTLRSAVTTDNGTTYPFNVPHFKIGTLDALVQQADELARLEGGCKGVVDKVADSLRSLLEGDEDKIQEQKVVNDRMCAC